MFAESVVKGIIWIDMELAILVHKIVKNALPNLNAPSVTQITY
jgi:hypothetical protein